MLYSIKGRLLQIVQLYTPLSKFIQLYIPRFHKNSIFLLCYNKAFY